MDTLARAMLDHCPGADVDGMELPPDMKYTNILILSFLLDEIEEYFGVTITMYFAFLGFYTLSLCAPAFVSLLSLYSTSPLMVPLICLFNTLWTVVFLESWKRSSVALAYNLGTLDLMEFEEARLEFYGEIGVDPVTGRSRTFSYLYLPFFVLN